MATSQFVMAGIVLLILGLLYLLIASRARTGAYKVAAGITVAASLLLVWGNLAVGFIGSEDNPANLLYAGALIVGFIGAILAKLQPLGMAKALFATAFAQFAVPFIAMSIWRPELNRGVLMVIVLNTIFAGLWVVSGWLFRRAGAAGSRLGQQVA